MNKETISERADSSEQDIVLISKIYESFEALEETLGKLKLEEPLFITHVAKISFEKKNNSTKKKKNDRKKLKRLKNWQLQNKAPQQRGFVYQAP